ncbi:MAG TPA: YdcF family protein [Candidatus Saccharimonadales bacterium]|jgi:uncharacterized SAM-binding protein YcdF (DUF218 family)
MTETEIDEQAKIIWNYMQLHEQPQKSDAVFCLCSHDTRVAERAAELFLDGYGDWLIFSGSGKGRITEKMFDKSEAATFADIALDMGVTHEKIIIEEEATNTGKNIQFVYKLLQTRGLYPKSFVLVQKPHMERRTYATFKKQWPDADTKISVTSPQIPYDKYFNAQNPKRFIIESTMGGLQRILEYPKRGFQIKQEIPAKVWAAYEKLVAAGFDGHLIAK